MFIAEDSADVGVQPIRKVGEEQRCAILRAEDQMIMQTAEGLRHGGSHEVPPPRWGGVIGTFHDYQGRTPLAMDSCPFGAEFCRCEPRFALPSEHVFLRYNVSQPAS